MPCCMSQQIFRLRFSSRRARVQASVQAGFSLIEVMVTMVILSFGMLGVAGLLVSGVSNAAASEATAKASQLAADMADRIRANPAVALSASSEYITAYSDVPPSSPSTIAQADKKVWLEALAAQLPDGDGQITNSVAGGARKLDITVRWNNCLGTLSTADRTSCTNNSTTAYKSVTFELRL